MDESLLFFSLLLFSFAFLYSSVGHGGASAYLALMALFSFDNQVMKQTALSLNLVVAAISFIQFYRSGFFILRLFIFLAISSIPLAFVGGMIDLKSQSYKLVLGFFLLISVVRLFLKSTDYINLINKKKINIVVALIIGASIGFVSGLIGIGGGILLSPILLMLKWSDVKNTASVSALFIWVNSAAGLAGQINSGIKLDNNIPLFIIVVTVGAIFGGYWGSKSLSFINLEKVLLLVLLAAAIKLIFFK